MPVVKPIRTEELATWQSNFVLGTQFFGRISDTTKTPKKASLAMVARTSGILIF